MSITLKGVCLRESPRNRHFTRTRTYDSIDYYGPLASIIGCNRFKLGPATYLLARDYRAAPLPNMCLALLSSTGADDG